MQTRVLDGVIRGTAAPLRLTPSGGAAMALARPMPLGNITMPGRFSMDGLRVARPLTPANVVAEPEPILDQVPTQLAKKRLELNWANIAMTSVMAPAIIASTLNGFHAISNKQIVTSTAAPITSTRTAAASPSPDTNLLARQAALHAMLTSFAAAQPANVGIVIKDLKTGEQASINSGQVFTSASLYKLFVAGSVYRQAEDGKISLGAPAGGGTGRNVRDCLKIMINISDNGCGRALGAMLKWGAQNETLKAQGFSGTDMRSPQKTTAADVALLMERLYNGTLLGPTNTDEYMQFLKQQRVNNRLPLGVPAGTTMAHKTGDLDGYVHDAGIIYGPKTDYLVVMTSGPWKNTGQAPAAFSSLSAKAYAHFNQ